MLIAVPRELSSDTLDRLPVNAEILGRARSEVREIEVRWPLRGKSALPSAPDRSLCLSAEVPHLIHGPGGTAQLPFRASAFDEVFVGEDGHWTLIYAVTSVLRNLISFSDYGAKAWSPYPT